MDDFYGDIDALRADAESYAEWTDVQKWSLLNEEGWECEAWMYEIPQHRVPDLVHIHGADYHFEFKTSTVGRLHPSTPFWFCTAHYHKYIEPAPELNALRDLQRELGL